LDEPEVLDSFVHQTTPPGATADSASQLIDALSMHRSADDTQYLLRGLHATVGLFQLATNSAEFLSMAAQAMIDVVGLETAAALMWDGGEWRTEAICVRGGSPRPEDSEWVPSRSILTRVKDERKTFWRVPDLGHSASLVDVKALVAAPILNRKAEVIGALYGDRRRRVGGAIDLQITEVEAILVELLSTSVAAGFARLEHEKAAVEARVLFEQFFTPELSRQLEAQPDLLLGKDTDVTLLFCDIRRFSEVSEQLGARLTIDWIQDVMETLSSCVAAHHGVLVDTLGDRLIGMWGAPVERKDHAELACRAAIAMVEQLPAVNRRWLNALDRPVDLGIGINTGIARVGNIGSTSKFKYGPLGTTVRVASRVEQATRALMVKILVTDTTVERLPDDLATRRLFRLDNANGEQPIHLFELAADTPADWPDMKRRYESALDAYDRGDLPTATRLLAKLLSDHPSDRASLRLLTQIEARLP
jgi:adenylate cyclase